MNISMASSVYKILYDTWFNFLPKMLGITVLLQSNEIWYLLVNHSWLHIGVSEIAPWMACISSPLTAAVAEMRMVPLTPQMVVLFGTLVEPLGGGALLEEVLHWVGPCLPSFLFFLSATGMPSSLRHLRPCFPSPDRLHPARTVSQKKCCLQ